MGDLPLKILPCLSRGGGVGGWVLEDHSRMPRQEDKGLEGPEICQSSSAGLLGRGREPPPSPPCCASPADGKYWCCDFINKGFCEPEKHGIRMNYFLSCGLARFANLGVFGPSPGNKPKSLPKRRRDADAAEQ